MTKKATNLKTVAVGSLHISRRRGGTRPLAEASSSDDLKALDLEPSQAFASEDQALHSLISSITDKLGDHGVEKGQMHEFLSLILDTDPVLKEEILRGIRGRK